MNQSLDESRNRAWKLFLSTHTLLNDRMEAALAEAGLPNLAWYDVLWTLEQAPENHLRLHELADAMIFNRSNLTRLIDRMEEAGLVCRKTCRTDRRGAFAGVTEAGLAMRQKMWMVYSQAIDSYFGQQLQDGEVEILNAALTKILDHLRVQAVSTQKTPAPYN